MKINGHQLQNKTEFGIVKDHKVAFINITQDVREGTFEMNIKR